MTTEIFNDAVEIQGSQDIVQLQVEGPGSQTANLQEWRIAGVTAPVARLTSDGRLQVGVSEMGTPDALIEANNEVDVATSPAKPRQGIQSRGRITGAIVDGLAWMVGELELLGSGGITGIHTALRSKLLHNKAGDATNADLRAGDFEVVNQSGTALLPVGQVTGLQSTITNQEDAYIDEAVGVEVRINDAGDIQKAYGLRVEDIPQITENYAIHTGDGPVHLGDYLELEPPTSAVTKPTSGVRLYPKADGKLYLYGSADVAEHEVGLGATSLGDLTDVGSANPINGYMLRADGDSWEAVNPANYVFVKQTGGGIDINTTTNPVAINADSNTNARVDLSVYHANTHNFPQFKFIRGRGTKAAKAAVQNGDVLGEILFQGYRDNLSSDEGAFIRAEVDHYADPSNPIGDGGIGTRLEFVVRNADPDEFGSQLWLRDEGSIVALGKCFTMPEQFDIPLRTATDFRGLFPLSDGWYDIDDTRTAKRLATSDEVASSIPSGCMMVWPTNTPPMGWLLCAGQLLSMTSYKSLLDVLLADIPVASLGYDAGTSCTADYITDSFTALAHGMVDGTVVMFSGTTLPSGLDETLPYYVVSSAPDAFIVSTMQNGEPVEIGSNGSNVKFHQQFKNLDLRGRVVLGQDNMGGISANRVTDAAADILDGASGAETVTLATAQIPAHAHIQRKFSGSGTEPIIQVSNSGGAGQVNITGVYSNTTANAGGGQSHNNMPPYLTLNYIIKA